mmetsp:Transcript_4701/g.7309  ORF Transcript_4701/g.7309 Transcript_4701/m.7309 type:complete len:387 (+) Transcript_4701:96-1256(+)
MEMVAGEDSMISPRAREPDEQLQAHNKDGKRARRAAKQKEKEAAIAQLQSEWMRASTYGHDFQGKIIAGEPHHYRKPRNYIRMAQPYIKEVLGGDTEAIAEVEKQLSQEGDETGKETLFNVLCTLSTQKKKQQTQYQADYQPTEPRPLTAPYFLRERTVHDVDPRAKTVPHQRDTHLGRTRSDEGDELALSSSMSMQQKPQIGLHMKEPRHLQSMVFTGGLSHVSSETAYQSAHQPFKIGKRLDAGKNFHVMPTDTGGHLVPSMQPGGHPIEKYDDGNFIPVLPQDKGPLMLKRQGAYRYPWPTTAYAQSYHGVQGKHFPVTTQAKVHGTSQLPISMGTTFAKNTTYSETYVHKEEGFKRNRPNVIFSFGMPNEQQAYLWHSAPAT